jgi:GNAT superfamily N-acetyltransferase
MIRTLAASDFDAILEVINHAARAYKGAIPGDRWKEPCTPAEESRKEIETGVRFFGWTKGGRVLGVAGIQALPDTTLIRHAYVLAGYQMKRVGTRLLKYLIGLAGTHEVLVGTWADGTQAIHFYEKNGFKPVSPGEKDRLLRAYWSIPERRIETSVVLGTSSL